MVAFKSNYLTFSEMFKDIKLRKSRLEKDIESTLNNVDVI